MNKYAKMPYTIFYENEKGYVTLRSDTNKIKTIDKHDMENFKNYKMFDVGIDQSHEGLYEYHKKFITWVNELKAGVIFNKKKYSIDWLSYVNNHTAVIQTFMTLSNYITKTHEQIKEIEYLWMSKCNLGGIRYLDEKYKGNEFVGYGYDFEFCHPYALASRDLKIPTKAGKEYIIKELPTTDNVFEKTGYYKVEITCKNKDFAKVFAFSEHHVYTNRSLYFALKHKERFNVSIKLFDDDKPNAYIYDDSCLVTSYSIFGIWNRILYRFKLKFPKNPLIKFLGSSLSGSLNKVNKVWMTSKQADKVDANFFDKIEIVNQEVNDNGKIIKYCVVYRDNYYLYNVRFRPFLLSFIRNKLSRVTLRNIEGCIRVYEDAVIFNEPLDVSKIPDMKPEAKSSGLLKFNAVNNYDKTYMKFVKYFKENDQKFYDALCKMTIFKEWIKNDLKT